MAHVHETIQTEVSDVLHKYIHDLDGLDPEDLNQCVYDALNDFVTEFNVITVRIQVTEDGLVTTEVYT